NEQLRVFKDRGNVHGFFPNAGDLQAHSQLLDLVPNLDCYDGPAGFDRLIKNSLGNVLRVTRPIIVIDEGHRSYSELARKTLLDFNPDFMLELTATPVQPANPLVAVSGADLEREEMIRLPINVTVKPGPDWRECLLEAYEKLQELQ